jgi:hypothetical protein
LSHFMELVNKIDDLPAQPKATWKRLVQDMQVTAKGACQHSARPRASSLCRFGAKGPSMRQLAQAARLDFVNRHA